MLGMDLRTDSHGHPLIHLLSVWVKTLGLVRDTCAMKKHNYLLTLQLTDDLMEGRKGPQEKPRVLNRLPIFK